MLLALDISTTQIGWSLWDRNVPIKIGYVRLVNSKNEPKELGDRLDLALNELKKIDGVTKIVAEAALQKFSKGQSQAATINKLIAMNFSLCYALSRYWSVPFENIEFSSARKKAGIKIPRQPKSEKKDPNLAKKIITEKMSKLYPNLIEWDLERYGKYKSQWDMADSLVIGLASV